MVDEGDAVGLGGEEVVEGGGDEGGAGAGERWRRKR